jgi:hypothetical protein
MPNITGQWMVLDPLKENSYIIDDGDTAPHHREKLLPSVFNVSLSRDFYFNPHYC